MKKQSVEISVGLFVLIGLVCVAYLTVKLGKMEILGGHYFHVSANFASVSGLKEGATIDMAGVGIGQVETIRLDPQNWTAQVTMKIREGVVVTDDSIASVKTSGLIGDKYISIAPGGSEKHLEDGGRITETEPAVDLESMISKYAFGKV
jgi:phospholipid/cholesterol/gamma-HCH transport system substrate-binding protein